MTNWPITDKAFRASGAATKKERSDKREHQPLVNGRGRGYVVKTAVAGNCSRLTPTTSSVFAATAKRLVQEDT